MSTLSKSNDSKWVKVGGQGVQWRVEDGLFMVKTETPMLGYLNAPSPFSEDGWYNTGDRVNVDGEYVEFLGRACEIINVAGEKVYPQEVEDVLLSIPNVVEAMVRGVSNPITGQTILAELILGEDEQLRELKKRVKLVCKSKLARYKVPTQIRVVEKEFIGKRLKKYRMG
jgi:acyl-coenzyme A synthetase/AMP-(fatty) acid ligase